MALVVAYRHISIADGPDEHVLRPFPAEQPQYLPTHLLNDPCVQGAIDFGFLEIVDAGNDELEAA